MEAPSLARSWKLQEHVWEWGGALTPVTSLRLEVTYLVACLRGQWPESESLSWLCFWSMWIEALLVIMTFLRTQIGNCRIWSDWKCNGLLLLVVLALSRPEKALWWLLSPLLRYSFCGICGNELEGLALVAWGQKSLYPHWPTLHHLFCYHIYWRGDTQEGHLGCCASIYDSLFLLWSGLYSGMCTGTRKMDASPRSPSLGNIPGKLLCTIPRGVRGKGEIIKRSWWYGTRNKSGMPSGLHLVHLHPTSVVEPEGTSTAPASVRDRLSLTREGKLWWKVCLYTPPSI